MKTGITPSGWIFLFVAAALAVAACSGCTSIPNGAAGEYHRRLNVLGVVSTADATGIKKTDTGAKVEHAAWSLSFPGFDLKWELKDGLVKTPKEIAK